MGFDFSDDETYDTQVGLAWWFWVAIVVSVAFVIAIIAFVIWRRTVIIYF